MKQFSSTSSNECAFICVAEEMCAAFSHHDEQCFLHSSLCDVDNLPSAEGSSYSGKCLLKKVYFGITHKMVNDRNTLKNSYKCP